MKKVVCLLVLIVSVIFPCSLFARTICVDGYGATLRDAEADAVRNAVESAVGAMVDSTTLVSNGEIVEDKIFSHSQGYVNNYRVVSKVRENKGWKVSLEAEVDITPDSKLMSELTRLGIIDATLRNPRIAVLMSMRSRSDRDNRNLAETAIIECLVENGFSHVTDVENTAVIRPLIYRYEVDALRQFAAKNKVDIVVFGQVTSSRVGDVGKYLGKGRSSTGTLSYQADASLKMYMAKTDRIVAAVNRIGNGLGITDEMASHTAIKNACVNVTNYCIEKLLQSGAGQSQYVTVCVRGSDFSKINMVKRALEACEHVKNVQVREYRDGVGKLTVQFSGSAESLFKYIERKAECIVEIEKCSYDELVVRAY